MTIHDQVRVGDLPYRIRSRIVTIGECWIWTGAYATASTGKRYGRVSFRGHGGPDVWLVHRVTYTLLVGPIPEGLQLDHLIESSRCTDTLCCNPAHTEPVTQKVNMGRSPTHLSTIHRSKLTCPQGHPYSGNNLRLSKQSDGSNRMARFCRKCHAATEQRRRDRLRASISR